MIGLTPKQAEVLRYVAGCLEKSGGIGPTLEEVREAVGLSSKSEVHRYLTQLEDRGFIRRLRHRARAVEIVTPEDRVPEPQVIILPPEPPQPIVQRIRAAGDDEFRVILKTVSEELLRRRAAA